MRSEDESALVALWIAGWREVFPELNIAERGQWLRGELSSLAVQGTEIWVAVSEPGDIAGFVTIDPAGGHLEQLAVDPRVFGGGAAQALMSRARGRSPGHIDLLVNQANTRAVRFYEREGFVVTGVDVSAWSGLPLWRMEWVKPARGSTGAR
jgi:putative acetyltransferase